VNAVDVYWLPLGTGGHSVRLNGRVYEWLVARRDGRAPLDLYHAALEVHVEGVRYTIEVTPALHGGDARGVVSVGPVGSRVLGRSRLFRYELRRWRDGVIPDVVEAVASPRRVSDEAAQASLVLSLVPDVPMAVWGRDEYGCGEMWNSNSVVAWLLARSGVDAGAIEPPRGGRAPGWRSGIVAASPHDGALSSLPRHAAAES
jgi:hypothetical protein